MWVKYLISSVDFTIGIKCNLFTREIVIGGDCRYAEQILFLMERYCNPVMSAKTTFTGYTKIRYSFISVKKFFDIIKNIRESGISVQQVKVHGRIMR